MNEILYTILIISLITACNNKQKPVSKEPIPIIDSLEVSSTKAPVKHKFRVDYDTLSWTEITWEKDSIVLDLKYATKDNFTDQVIYPCARCFLRPVLAEKLKKMSSQLYKDRKARFKLFDCYRPRPAQEKLWSIVPDASYVTPPEKGSMHNRGLALDVTIVDDTGNEWDMGTGFDDFTRASHIDYEKLSQEVLQNRAYLRSIMNGAGLSEIRTEWWHFSLAKGNGALSKWQWNCTK